MFHFFYVFQYVQYFYIKYLYVLIILSSTKNMIWKILIQVKHLLNKH